MAAMMDVEINLHELPDLTDREVVQGLLAEAQEMIAKRDERMRACFAAAYEAGPDTPAFMQEIAKSMRMSEVYNPRIQVKLDEAYTQFQLRKPIPPGTTTIRRLVNEELTKPNPISETELFEKYKTYFQLPGGNYRFVNRMPDGSYAMDPTQIDTPFLMDSGSSDVDM